MSEFPKHIEAVVIGAGPAGCVAASLLHQAGVSVVVVERAQFPRFSIGESLLPRALESLQRAGLLDAVKQQADRLNFQYKDGARFWMDTKNLRGITDICFAEGCHDGHDYAYEVRRAEFDHCLAQAVAAQGVPIYFGWQVSAFAENDANATLTLTTEANEVHQLTTDFVFDASGFGRVLPRLLDLERSSDFPPRQAVFTHIHDHITDADYDRNKIVIGLHSAHPELWFWLIPFHDNVMSVGLVGEPKKLSQLGFDAECFAENPDLFKSWFTSLLSADSYCHTLFEQAEYPQPVQTLTGYAADVTAMHGERFALLGNAAEFLDPIFSSGVTIAMVSAELATDCYLAQRAGQSVDWQQDFADELCRGVSVFKAYVNSWYNGELPVIFSSDYQPVAVKSKLTSILAGYVWDESNPYTKRSSVRLTTLVNMIENNTAQADV